MRNTKDPTFSINICGLFYHLRTVQYMSISTRADPPFGHNDSRHSCEDSQLPRPLQWPGTFSRIEGLHPMVFTKIQVSLLQSKADSGDVTAQLELAEIYRTGKGVASSISKALRYYIMAARQNSPAALYFLADCQDRGVGTPADPSSAFQNYLKAAKLGHTEACLAVGHFYEVGRACFQDINLAKQFYQAAAQRGNKAAASKLADLERTGGRLSSISPLDRSRVNRGGDDDVRKTSALRKLATELISRAEDVSRLEAVIKLLR